VIVGGRAIRDFRLGVWEILSTEWRLWGQLLRRVGVYQRDAPEAQSAASVQMGTLWFANYLSRFGPNVRSSELGRRRCAL
jgi:hypothetical protein